MARSELEFHARFYRGFGNVKAAAKNVGRVMSKLRAPLQRDLKAHARQQSSPDGKWPKRARRAEVLARRRRATVRRGRVRAASKTRGARQAVRFIGGGNLLGKLPDTVVVRKRGAEIEARSPVPWSGVHNIGGRVGYGAEIKARPFVFISPKIQGLAAEKLADHLVMRWAD